MMVSYKVVENGIDFPQGSAHLVMCGNRPAASVPDIDEAYLFAAASDLLAALRPLSDISVSSDAPDDFVILDLGGLGVGSGKILAGDVKRARAAIAKTKRTDA